MAFPPQEPSVRGVGIPNIDMAGETWERVRILGNGDEEDNNNDGDDVGGDAPMLYSG